MYTDGANMNALVGVAKPGKWGSGRVAPQPAQDLLHPARRRRSRRRPGRAVKAHLAPFPKARWARTASARRHRCWAMVSAATLRLGLDPADQLDVHRDDGRRRPRKADPGGHAQRQLPGQAPRPHYPTLYTGRNGLVAHECILDLRPIKDATGISAEDVANA